MTLSEIRNEAWDIARDTALVDSDRLWPKAMMNRYINRIYRYIARETKCIKDAYTSSVCQIDISPPADLAELQTRAATDVWAAYDLEEYNRVDEDGRPDSWLYGNLVAPRCVPLHASIIDIDEVKWRHKPWKLMRVSVSKWQQNPYWEQILGYPTEFCTDYSNGFLTLNYRTGVSDTLLLTVKRLPLVDLSADSDTPEFRVSYHDFFINGVLWQMYSRQDADTIDKAKAEEYRQAFLRDIDEIKQQEVIYDQRLKVNSPMGGFL